MNRIWTAFLRLLPQTICSATAFMHPLKHFAIFCRGILSLWQYPSSRSCKVTSKGVCLTAIELGWPHAAILGGQGGLQTLARQRDCGGLQELEGWQEECRVAFQAVPQGELSPGSPCQDTIRSWKCALPLSPNFFSIVLLTRTHL